MPPEISPEPAVQEEESLEVQLRILKEEVARLKQQNVALETENARLIQRSADLEKVATKDLLTGLDNRRGLIEKMDSNPPLKGEERREKQKPMAVLVLDIDNFKIVNDAYGYEKGDEVLRNVALILQEIVRHGDCVGRWGGEEFVIVFRNATAQDVIDKFHKGRETAGLSFGVTIGEEKMDITFSGGVAEFNVNGPIEATIDRV